MGLMCYISAHQLAELESQATAARELSVASSLALNELRAEKPEGGDEEDMAAYADAMEEASAIGADYQDSDDIPQFNVGRAAEAFKSAFDSTINDLCPVRTGYLKSTCQCTIDGNGGILCVAGAEYAQYVEYGTWRMAPQPYFEPAIAAGLAALLAYSTSEITKIENAVANVAENMMAEMLFSGFSLMGIIALLLIVAIVVALLEILRTAFDSQWEDLLTNMLTRCSEEAFNTIII